MTLRLPPSFSALHQDMWSGILSAGPSRFHSVELLCMTRPEHNARVTVDTTHSLANQNMGNTNEKLQLVAPSSISTLPHSNKPVSICHRNPFKLNRDLRNSSWPSVLCPFALQVGDVCLQRRRSSERTSAPWAIEFSLLS